MNNLDDQIRKALNPSDAEMLGDPDDGLRVDQLVISTFRSRHWIMTVPIVVVSLVVFALSIWCLVRFFDATEVQHMIGWAMGVITGTFMIGFMKVWFWMEMQRIAITREVKRVELLSARLIQKLDHSNQESLV